MTLHERADAIVEDWWHTKRGDRLSYVPMVERHLREAVAEAREEERERCAGIVRETAKGFGGWHDNAVAERIACRIKKPATGPSGGARATPDTHADGSERPREGPAPADAPSILYTTAGASPTSGPVAPLLLRVREALADLVTMREAMGFVSGHRGALRDLDDFMERARRWLSVDVTPSGFDPEASESIFHLRRGRRLLLELIGAADPGGPVSRPVAPQTEKSKPVPGASREVQVPGPPAPSKCPECGWVGPHGMACPGVPFTAGEVARSDLVREGVGGVPDNAGPLSGSTPPPAASGAEHVALWEDNARLRTVLAERDALLAEMAEAIRTVARCSTEHDATCNCAGTIGANALARYDNLKSPPRATEHRAAACDSADTAAVPTGGAPGGDSLARTLAARLRGEGLLDDDDEDQVVCAETLTPILRTALAERDAVLADEDRLRQRVMDLQMARWRREAVGGEGKP